MFNVGNLLRQMEDLNQLNTNHNVRMCSLEISNTMYPNIPKQVIIKCTNIITTLSDFNGLHHKLQFTMENEMDGTLFFF
jgi:hypothetical protein